jgi:choline dehydrogenase-like flavoprotein
MELLPQGLPSFAQNIVPDAWGRDRASIIESYPNIAGVWLIGEDLSRETNRITLHPDRKDKFGMPIPNVHSDDHPNDLAMQNHAMGQADALYKSIGARRTIHRLSFPSTHNMGTNRMSDNPSAGVVNHYGQSHDVRNLFVSDGSQFTSSSSENPTLTIVALAMRQAEYIRDKMAKSEV